MTSQKGNVLIIVLALVSLVALASLATAGYFYLQSQKPQSIVPPQTANPIATTPSRTALEETDNWKPYTDSKNRFTFKYPSTMSVLEEKSTYNTYTVRNNDYTQANWSESYNIEIQLSTLPDADTFTRMAGLNAMTGEKIPVSITRLNLNGNNTIVVQYDPPHQTSKNYYVYNSNLAAAFNGSGTNHGTGHKTLDLLLTTFKFLDQNPTNQTSNWKTFSSPIMGISFKYPPDYSLNPNFPDPQGSANTFFTSLTSPNPKGEFPGNNDLVISFRISPTNGKTIDQTVSENRVGNQTQETLVPTNVGSNNAIRYIWQNSTMGSNGEIFITINGPKSLIIYKTPAVTSRQETFNQILSTFKFL